MKKIYLILILFSLGCSSTRDNIEMPVTQAQEFKLLSLGDSYTIGQSVCETCRFPEQLKTGLMNYSPASGFQLDVIATTGWTTSSLIAAINDANLSTDYNLVTLLIGVNNQFQDRPFSVYQEEFPKLVAMAANYAGGDKNRIIIISIPDYAYTPFGESNGNGIISEEIDMYNDFARDYALQNDISFIDITDITRLGLENPDLVASDGLHPSELAYSKFVERLLPVAIEKLF